VIRVFVLARSAVVRAGLESIVQSSSVLELAGAAGQIPLPDADLERADVLLADWGEPGADSIESLGKLQVPVVLLVDPLEETSPNSALRSGIRGVISSESAAEEIEGAVQAVNAGLVVTTPAASAALLGEPRTRPEALREPLSDRELEVLSLIAEGLSNKIIAYRLEISEHTVKTHVTAILAKLDAASRTEAVAQAVRRGLVML
jgi:NarL family two-component system response regulator YdfI